MKSLQGDNQLTASAEQEQSNPVWTGTWPLSSSGQPQQCSCFEACPISAAPCLQRAKIAAKALPLLLPNVVELAPPAGEPGAAKWKKQLEQDGATIRARANRKTLADAMARCAALLDIAHHLIYGRILRLAISAESDRKN